MKIFLFALLIAFALFLTWCWFAKVKIKWKTFLKRGFAPKRGDFGLYVPYTTGNKEKVKHIH